MKAIEQFCVYSGLHAKIRPLNALPLVSFLI